MVTAAKQSSHRFATEFPLALKLFQQGDFKASQSICERVIRLHPESFEAYDLLGVICLQMKDYHNAHTYLRRVTSLSPSYATGHYHQGQALKGLGSLHEAVESYKTATRLNPHHVQSLFQLGSIFHQKNQLSEALALFDRVIAIDKKHHAAFSIRAVVLKKLHRLEEALESYDASIALHSGNHEVHFNRSLTLVDLGRLDEAAESLNRAITLRQDYSAAHRALGFVMERMRNFDEAIISHEKAIELDPEHAETYSNLANAQKEKNLFEEAIANYKKAVALKPTFAGAYCDLGNALLVVNRFDEAIESFEKASLLEPGTPILQWNEGIARLKIGDFARGWHGYERRLAVEALQASSFEGHAKIDAEFSIHNERADLIGKSIFIASEQGVGDCIMFMSILLDLCRDAKSIVCQLDQRLIEIFSRHFPEVTFVETGDVSILEKVQIDRYIRMGSLGYTYRRTIEDFPGTAYLTPDTLRVAHWKTKLPRDGNKQLVGVSWRGGSAKTNGANRSLTLEQLAPLLDREDCSFVSLQYGEVADEIAAFNEKRTNKLIYFPKSEIDDFEDLTSLIAALDGVVSVENTTIDVAGAIGARCAAILPTNNSWKYGVKSRPALWYSSINWFHEQEISKIVVNPDIIDFLMPYP